MAEDLVSASLKRARTVYCIDALRHGLNGRAQFPFPPRATSALQAPWPLRMNSQAQLAYDATVVTLNDYSVKLQKGLSP